MSLFASDVYIASSASGNDNAWTVSSVNGVWLWKFIFLNCEFRTPISLIFWARS